MNNYRIKQAPSRIDDEFLNYLKNCVSRYPNYTYVINYKNTKTIKMYEIDRIERIFQGRVQIRVEGGYDDHRISSYSSSVYVNMHKYDNIYTTSEIRKIMREIEKIEMNMNPNWSAEQKLMYFIGALKNKIIYHPFHETAPSKDIRSLRGLISHNTVCAGYAIILKELCDRNGIECQYVEGCTNQEDYEKGWLTHAWNIVKINDKYFPLDLTWNAGRNAKGKSMSMTDVANVNDFVRSHIPGKYELIQDYQGMLKSMDGSYLRAMNNLINKDMTYELSTMVIDRNGKRIYITQVEEFVVENKCVYKYIYNVVDEKGKFREPHIFYSGTNVLEIVRGCQRKKKLENELAKARREGALTTVERITKALIGSEHLNDANDFIDNLLFARENLIVAHDRGDNYIGEVKVDYDEDGRSKAVGVIIDPVFAEKITKKQRRFTRSDGSTFVIEECKMLKLPNGEQVYRYIMYENVKTSNGIVTKKNTIFTDQDLMHDNRRLLVDDFLSRSRIDRKSKEASGYLGFYSRNNVRTYDPNKVRYFNDSLYRMYRMNNGYVKDYVPELSFNDMKRMVQVYTTEYINGKVEVVNRKSGRVVTDPIIKSHAQFSLIWLQAAGIKWMGYDEVPGYSYAYEVYYAEEIFNEISSLITESIHNSGNIEPLEILRKISDKHGIYKYAEQIVMNLFDSSYNINIINNFYRQQNHSSVQENKSIEPLNNGLGIYEKLRARRKQLEEEKKKLMEVIEVNGSVKIVPARSK